MNTLVKLVNKLPWQQELAVIKPISCQLVFFCLFDVGLSGLSQQAWLC